MLIRPKVIIKVQGTQLAENITPGLTTVGETEHGVEGGVLVEARRDAGFRVLVERGSHDGRQDFELRARIS